MTSPRTALGRTPVRLGAYLAAVALAFGLAYVAGAWLGPAPQPAPEAAAGGHGEPAMADAGHADDAADDAAGHAATAALPDGLQVSADGYTLRPVAAAQPAGPRVPFRFDITGPDGTPVTAYEPTHEKELHLIVVRRDLTGFQHVHPVRDAAGRWSVDLDLTAPGTYRVFADFAPAADPSKKEPTSVTLGTDIAVAGRFAPAPLPAPATRTSVAGYDVTLAGSPLPGRETELTFTVQRDGAPVTGLQPYLGAFGHLVSLRAGDLAYLHTHPAEEARPGTAGGPDVRFATTFPTAGDYRLYLDFQVDGAVRTAAFTVHVP
jgi:hypothetical protein